MASLLVILNGVKNLDVSGAQIITFEILRLRLRMTSRDTPLRMAG